MIKKYYYNLFIALMAAVGFTACGSDEDDYKWATTSGPQVYFSSALGNKYDITVQENSFTIPVNRVDTKGALTVPLQVETTEGCIFNVPSSVSFEDGKNEANLVVSYNPNDVVYGDYATINLKINDESLSTPYGASTYSFTAGATEWVDYGTAMYRDGLVAPLYGLAPSEWAVKIEKSIVREGLYRIEAPYSTGAFSAYFKDGAELNTTLLIDASDPDFVTIEPFDSGVTLNSNDGELSFLTFVSYYLNRGKALADIKAETPQYFGKLQDNIISFATPNSWLATIGGNGYYYGNSSGMLRIALPGAVLKDFSVDFVYSGRFTDIADVDYAQGQFTFGPDIESAIYSVVKASEADATLEGLLDGSIEGIEVPADGKISVPLTETGKYSAVVVAYCEGKVVATESFDFKFKASGETVETWTPAFVGTYVFGAKSYAQDGSLFFDEVITQEGLTLYQSDQNESHYRIAPWIQNENGLDFILNEDGTIEIEEVETGIVDEEWGMIYVTDIKTYGAADLDSYYEKGTFYFNLAYHDYDGAWAFVQDTFTLTGEAAAKLAAKVSKAKASKASLKHKNQLAVRYLTVQAKKFTAK